MMENLICHIWQKEFSDACFLFQNLSDANNPYKPFIALKAYEYQVGSFPTFSRYLVIPQYLLLKYRDKVFINTAHP